MVSGDKYVKKHFVQGNKSQGKNYNVENDVYRVLNDYDSKLYAKKAPYKKLYRKVYKKIFEKICTKYI